MTNNRPGANVFGVENLNAAGYSAFTVRSHDKAFPNGGVSYEHGAWGFGQDLGTPHNLGVSYWESSRYNGARSAAVPPPITAIQQTGGVDPSGGVSSDDCRTERGSKSLACDTNLAVDGQTVNGAAVPPGTTVASGGGTKSIMLSTEAISTGKSKINFSTPSYHQFNRIVLGNGGADSYYGIGILTLSSGSDNVNGLPFTYFDTANGRVGVNTIEPLYSVDVIGSAAFGTGPTSDRALYARAPLNVVDKGAAVFSSVHSGFNTFNLSWETSPNRITHFDGNAGVAVLAEYMDGTKRVQVSAPFILSAYTVAGLPSCDAMFRDGLAVVTDASTPTYRGVLHGGGTERTPVFCDGVTWTAH